MDYKFVIFITAFVLFFSIPTNAQNFETLEFNSVVHVQEGCSRNFIDMCPWVDDAIEGLETLVEFCEWVSFEDLQFNCNLFSSYLESNYSHLTGGGRKSLLQNCHHVAKYGFNCSFISAASESMRLYKGLCEAGDNKCMLKEIYGPEYQSHVSTTAKSYNPKGDIIVATGKVYAQRHSALSCTYAETIFAMGEPYLNVTPAEFCNLIEIMTAIECLADDTTSDCRALAAASVACETGSWNVEGVILVAWEYFSTFVNECEHTTDLITGIDEQEWLVLPESMGYINLDPYNADVEREEIENLKLYIEIVTPKGQLVDQDEGWKRGGGVSEITVDYNLAITDQTAITESTGSWMVRFSAHGTFFDNDEFKIELPFLVNLFVVDPENYALEENIEYEGNMSLFAGGHSYYNVYTSCTSPDFLGLQCEPFPKPDNPKGNMSTGARLNYPIRFTSPSTSKELVSYTKLQAFGAIATLTEAKPRSYLGDMFIDIFPSNFTTTTVGNSTMYKKIFKLGLAENKQEKKESGSFSPYEAWTTWSYKIYDYPLNKLDDASVLISDKDDGIRFEVDWKIEGRRGLLGCYGSSALKDIYPVNVEITVCGKPATDQSMFSINRLSVGKEGNLGSITFENESCKGIKVSGGVFHPESGNCEIHSSDTTHLIFKVESGALKIDTIDFKFSNQASGWLKCTNIKEDKCISNLCWGGLSPGCLKVTYKESIYSYEEKEEKVILAGQLMEEDNAIMNINDTVSGLMSFNLPYKPIKRPDYAKLHLTGNAWLEQPTCSLEEIGTTFEVLEDKPQLGPTLIDIHADANKKDLTGDIIYDMPIYTSSPLAWIYDTKKIPEGKKCGAGLSLDKSWIETEYTYGYENPDWKDIEDIQFRIVTKNEFSPDSIYTNNYKIGIIVDGEDVTHICSGANECKGILERSDFIEFPSTILGTAEGSRQIELVSYKCNIGSTCTVHEDCLENQYCVNHCCVEPNPQVIVTTRSVYIPEEEAMLVVNVTDQFGTPLMASIRANVPDTVIESNDFEGVIGTYYTYFTAPSKDGEHVINVTVNTAGKTVNSSTTITVKSFPDLIDVLGKLNSCMEVGECKDRGEKPTWDDVIEMYKRCIEYGKC